MTEQEWLCESDPHSLLRCLQQRSGRARPRRKLRLFLCGCCRLVWKLTTPPDAAFIVDVAEKYVDGRASLVEMNAARQALQAERLAQWRGRLESQSHLAARLVASPNSQLWDAVHQATKLLAYLPISTALGRNEKQRSFTELLTIAVERKLLRQNEYPLLCALIRCTFGNPFRPSPSLLPSVLAWNDGTVRRMGEGIYHDRRFQDMPILADALEDAGCDDQDILNHCRQPGEHVRGCWLVDAILGKE